MRDGEESEIYRYADSTAVDLSIWAALQDLAVFIGRNNWSGRRERELVSLFAFGPFLRRARQETFLSDPRQIALEVRIPKPTGVGQGRWVDMEFGHGRDLVVWSTPGNVAGEDPLAIIEWKHEKTNQNLGADWNYETRRMLEYSSVVEKFVGYCVRTKGAGHSFQIYARRCRGGRAEELECTAASVSSSTSSEARCDRRGCPPTQIEIDRVVGSALNSFVKELQCRNIAPKLERDLIRKGSPYDYIHMACQPS